MLKTEPWNTSARERLLEAILQSAIDYGIFSLDLEGRITSWNEGAARLLGWTPQEAIGRPGDIIFTEEDRQAGRPTEEMQAALAQELAPDERWHVKKDGRLFWASSQMMALRSEDGALEGFVKILRDRTDQRETEERQRILMHELNHRMKNTLAVVQAITSQSFRGAQSMEEAAISISARLTAYSRAHDILLQRDWLSTTMSAIVEATAANLGLEGSDRFRMHGPAVEVGPQAALSYALVLHELATNAQKYGALCDEAGAVDLAWSVLEEGAKQRLRFSWTESGGPTVVMPARKGFGTRLIDSSLGAFGEVSISYRPEGLLVVAEADLDTLQNKAYNDTGD